MKDELDESDKGCAVYRPYPNEREVKIRKELLLTRKILQL